MRDLGRRGEVAVPALTATHSMEAEERTGQSDWKGLEGRSLLVMYGTETGHSQEIAEEIGEAAERLRFQTSVEPMNDVSLVSNNERCTLLAARP